jgi:hypothetical protein
MHACSIKDLPGKYKSSIQAIIIWPLILSQANGGFKSFVNFLGQVDKPLGKTVNLNSVFP